MTEVFGPFFLVWPSVKSLMEQLIRVQKLFLTGTVELKGACFWDLRGCWKHKFFFKKGNLSSEKNVLASFFS